MSLDDQQYYCMYDIALVSAATPVAPGRLVELIKGVMQVWTNPRSVRSRQVSSSPARPSAATRRWFWREDQIHSSTFLKAKIGRGENAAKFRNRVSAAPGPQTPLG